MIVAFPSGPEPESSTPCGYLSSPTLRSPGETDWSAHRPEAYPASHGHALGRPAGRQKQSPKNPATCNNIKLSVMSYVKTYPRFGIWAHDSCDRPNAIGLGDEAKARDDSGLREGYYLCCSQLLHLSLGKVNSKSQKNDLWGLYTHTHNTISNRSKSNSHNQALSA